MAKRSLVSRGVLCEGRQSDSTYPSVESVGDQRETNTPVYHTLLDAPDRRQSTVAATRRLRRADPIRLPCRRRSSLRRVRRALERESGGLSRCEAAEAQVCTSAPAEAAHAISPQLARWRQQDASMAACAAKLSVRAAELRLAFVIAGLRAPPVDRSVFEGLMGSSIPKIGARFWRFGA